MNYPTYPAAVCIVAVLCVLSWGSGCSRLKERVAAMPAPASAAIIDGQRGKDAVVISEAGKIAQEWPDAKPHTDAQLAAVAAAPAEDVARLNAQWVAVVANRDAIVADQSKSIARLEKELVELRSAFHNWFRRGCCIFGSLAMALGVASFFFIGQIASFSPWLAARMGPMISLSIFAFGATLLSTGIAYGWALENKTAVACILGVAALAVAIYFHGNHNHSKDEK